MVSKAVYIAIAAVVIIIIIVGLAVFLLNPPSGGSGPLTGTNINIYSKEYSFGGTSSATGNPTIQLKSGDTVTVTLHNVGTLAHNWAITSDRTDSSTNVAFAGAEIGSGSNPVASQGTQTTTFTVGAPGNYYYICQVPGHVSLGMVGTVTVTS